MQVMNVEMCLHAMSMLGLWVAGAQRLGLMAGVIGQVGWSVVVRMCG